MNGLKKILLTFLRIIARVRWIRTPIVALFTLIRRKYRNYIARNDLLIIEPSKTQDHVFSLFSRGYSSGVTLPKDVLAKILETLDGVELRQDNTGRVLSFEQASADNSSDAFRWLNPHLNADVIASIAYNEQILQVARQYLGCEPVLHSTQIWLLRPPTMTFANSFEYGWHYDIDDFKFLKLFFYLTDTEVTAGEHMLVAKSSSDMRLARLLHRRRTDTQIRDMYNEVDILKMHGAAGEGFFEDTWLYHRATPPKNNRIMFQVEYCATGLLKTLE